MQFLEFLGNYLLSGAPDSNGILALIITIFMIIPGVFIFDYCIDWKRKKKKDFAEQEKICGKMS